MWEWQRLVWLLDAELASVDIAVVNLACGIGLPGCDCPDVDTVARRLDTWTAVAKRFTDRAMALFRTGRCDYADSEPRFRIQALITCLQRDLGIRYRFDRRGDGAVFEPIDSFVQGIFQDKGGTCASLPVIYVSIGRRLGYPLKLATTRHHVYARWEDPYTGEAFNIEAAGDGISFFPDEHYRSGRYDMPLEEIEAYGYLRSLSPREELADFLLQRGFCWMEAKSYSNAAKAFAWAREVDPSRQQRSSALFQAIWKWDEELRPLFPPAQYPVLDIGAPPRQFAHVSPELEDHLIRLTVLDSLLKNPELKGRWRCDPEHGLTLAEPVSQGRLLVDFRWQNGGHSLTFYD
jgi:hypothetical protein